MGSAFITSCFLGILSSMKFVRLGRRGPRGWRSGDGASVHLQRRRIGHHPDCEGFKDHVVSIRGKKICGGCLGLALGSSVALLCMTAYLPGPSVPPGYGLLFVPCGLILVIVAFVEAAIHSRTGILHVLANILLVIGFLLITVGVPGATSNGATGLLAVLVSFLLLDTRIQISEWKHVEICRKCGQDCRSY